MPIELVFLWIATILVALLFVGVRLWLRHGRSLSSPGLAERAGSSGENGRSLVALVRWLTAPADWAAPRPAPGDFPLRSYTVGELRLPITLLLAGALLLLFMAQAIYAVIWPPLRGRVIWLIVAGLAAFALASFMIVRNRPPRWLEHSGRIVARYFGLSAAQLVLLFFAPCFALLAPLAAGDVLRSLNAPLSLTAWLLSLLCVLLGARQAGRAPARPIDRAEILLTAGLFVVALLLRGLASGQIPNTLSGDEGSSGLTALKFLSGEADNLLTVGWFSFPSFYFAVQSLGIVALGQTTEGLRLTSAVAGAVTVVGVYWLGRSMFGRKTALLAAAFLAASHYHIHFSRVGLNNIWDGLFAVVALAALWHGWQTGSRRSFLLCGLALGLGQYFYVTFRVFPVLILIWSLLAFWIDRATFRRRLPDLILAAVVALVVFLPLGHYFWQHPNEFSAPLNRVTILRGWLDSEVILSGRPASLIVRDQMLRTALGFTHEPLRLLYNPGSPLLLSGAAVLFLAGLLWAVVNLDLRYLLLLLPLLSVIFLGGLSQDPPASQRYMVAIPVVAVLVALPLAQITRWVRQSWSLSRRAVWPAALLVIFWLMVADINYYFAEVYDNYVLGGINTIVATDVAHYLQEQEEPTTVYFFGFPRMGYYSLSTIPYLAPAIEAQDVIDPLTAAPGWPIRQRTLFIFLPERIGELEHVRVTYPVGTYRESRYGDGTPLFMAYEVAAP